MNQHALAVLEYSRVLDLVAERAISEVGAERVRTLLPVSDLQWIRGEHARVAAVRALVTSEGGWTPEPVPDLRSALRALRVEGLSWNGGQLLDGARLLLSSRRTDDELRDERRPRIVAAVLGPLASRLTIARHLEEKVERAIDHDGSVKDDASSVLRQLRRELRGAQGQLVKLLERAMSRLEPHQAVPDMSVTVRNGRYVIPIRREARADVGGIVHDASSSGATLFVEPPAAVEFMNRIRDLEAEEAREVERILAELTEEFRPLRERLAETLDALAELDSLYARASYAERFDCVPADVCSPGDAMVVRHGRHPLLLAQIEGVVPFDLTMEPGERTLLLSGPNTGGKTVLLKTVGLVSAMFQAGIPTPVGHGSKLCIFDDIFADIGDEQSIEASLSTFSAHLRNLSEILRLATSRSLVLVDELGSGTDPVEGAALGGAILEELTRRGTLTLATTHLGALKLLATEVPGVVNASLQFDEVELAPTYRFIKGIPGRSYGLSIARRLQLPESVLQRAEERLPTGERDMASLLADLEKREVELREREAAVEHEAGNALARLREVSRREAAVKQREREADRQARKEARDYLLEARREIERTIAELRAAGADRADEVARDARRKVEDLAAKQKREIERLDTRFERSGGGGRRGGTAVLAPIAVGDTVKVGSLGGSSGKVLEIRQEDAVVAVGVMKLTVPLRELTPTAAPPVEPVRLRGDLPEDDVPGELDVRGMRADEMEGIVLQAIDAAVRADMRDLRIIHGKGTGALRERVAEMLRKDTRVKSFRLAAWNEGGTGVTVAEFS